MPLIKLRINQGANVVGELDELESRIIDATVNILEKKRQVTVLEIERPTVKNSIHGAKSNFSIEIYITKCTNSQEQKESWLKEIDKICNVYLVQNTSSCINYISIIELDGFNWGYNGISQNSRKDMRNDI